MWVQVLPQSSKTFAQITMVGEIVKVEDLGTQTNLTLDDGTGTVPVKTYPSNDEVPVRACNAKRLISLDISPSAMTIAYHMPLFLL